MQPSCKLHGHLMQSTLYSADLKGLAALTLNIAATTALEHLASGHQGSAETPLLISLTE